MSAFIKEFSDVSRPVRNTVFSQVEEALTTGGVGARIPIAQRGVEATQSATSQAATQTQASLASAGLGRTPFGQSILGAQQLQGQTQAANVYPQIAQQLMGIAPNLALGSAQSIIPGLGNAASIGNQFGLEQAGLNQRGQLANQQMLVSLFSSLAGSGAFSGAGAGLASLFAGGGGEALAGAGAAALI